MRSFKRSQRVADQIKRDASEIIADMLLDRRGIIVTVSRVDVTNDLRNATIYYTVLGDANQLEQVRGIFQHSTGYIQAELARRLRIRRMPEISLKYDKSLVEGLRLVSLIEDVMSRTDKKDDGSD